MAVALAAADTYVVVLALTDMMRGVGVGIDSLQRATPIVSGFLLGYVAVLPLVGRLADLVDRRRVLLGCLAVFVVGSMVTALAVVAGGLLVAGVPSVGRLSAARSEDATRRRHALLECRVRLLETRAHVQHARLAKCVHDLAEVDEDLSSWLSRYGAGNPPGLPDVKHLQEEVARAVH